MVLFCGAGRAPSRKVSPPPQFLQKLCPTVPAYTNACKLMVTPNLNIETVGIDKDSGNNKKQTFN